jgi:hypothetical protein
MSEFGDDYYYDDDGYVTNPPTDPGWGFTIVIVVVCVLINLSLPLWLRFGDILFRGNKQNREEENLEAAIPSPADVRALAPSIFSSQTGGSTPRSRPHLQPTTPPSVVSSGAASSVSGKFTEAILDARPKRSRIPGTGRKKKTKAMLNTTAVHPHRLDVRVAAEFAVAEQAYQKYTRQVTDGWTTASQAGTAADDRSDAAPSVLGKLDVDAISVQDAVDAKDYAGDATLNAKMPDVNSDTSCGWERLLEIADWEKEMRKFVYLAIPFSIQGLSFEFFAIVNVAIVGHFIGVKEANAFVVVTILLEFTATLNKGFAECQ